MKNFRQVIRKRGFQLRILSMGIICALIAVVLTAGGVLLVTSHATDILSRDLISKLAGQIILNIESTINKVQSLLVNITLDQKVLDILEKSDSADTPISYKDSIFLQNRMMQTQIIQNDIHALYIFDSTGNAYYSELSPSLKRAYNIKSEKWYSKLSETRGIKLLGCSIPDRYLSDKTHVVTMIQRYENLKNHKTLATIVVDIRLDVFDRIMSSLGLSPEYHILLLDDRNQLIYSNKKARMGDSAEDDLYKAFISQEGGEFRENVGSGKTRSHVFWESTKSVKIGWTVICGATITDISGINQMIRPMALGLVAFIVLLTAIVLSMITKRLFRTLNVLRKGMNLVKIGQLGTHIPVSTDDEIGDLSSTFNDMSDRLQSLMWEVETLEREKQEVRLRMVKAELRALQTQIRPHFIYNTLESISMLAEIKDDYEVQQMATALGKLLRISIMGNALVLVKEELEHVENYILIQRIRLDDRIRMELDVEPVLMNCVVPKLILQPIVENCINHGLDESMESETIQIRGKLVEGNVVLTISDNGKGMSEAELIRVRRMILDSDSENSDNHHIGLSNVHQRIKLRYQMDVYGLSIDSVSGGGATVTICIPATTEGQTV